MIVVYIILGLVVLLLIIAALLPKSYNVEKSTIIKRTPTEVMNKVGDLNYYSKWNPWQQMDPTAKPTITGTPKTPGHKYAWEGKKDGESQTIEWSLLDFFDHETKISSMARTTGYTCTAAVNLIAQNLFNEKGVFPPELVGKHKDCFDFVLDYLKERKVNWTKKEN